jgi:rRNA maturation endonuclease Nob1
MRQELPDEVIDRIIEEYKRKHDIKTYVVKIQTCRACNKNYPVHIFGHEVHWCPYCGETARNGKEIRILSFKEVQEAARLNGKWL